MSSHEAIEQCRINCMKYSWVIDLDIKGFFDNIDHELLLKAVEHYTDKKHILLYVKRWIEVAVELPDGTIKPSEGKGTPRSEEHTSELQSRPHLVCRLLLEKKKKTKN